MASEPPIAFIADTHDRTFLLEQLKKECLKRDVQTLVHLGDVSTPETLWNLTVFDLHFVHGNADHPRDEMQQVVEECGGSYHGEETSLTFGEATFFLHHGVDHGKSYGIARADNGVHYVMHGHWHYQEHNEYENGEVFNPGSEGVYFYDPVRDEFEHVEIESVDKLHS